VSARADLLALQEAADTAAVNIAAAHPDPDLYAEHPERDWVILARLELDDLAAAVDDVRRHISNALHTDDTEENRR